MSKILIIAEKPDVTKKIIFALDKNAKWNGSFYESEKYIFSNAVGHILREAYPKEIDPKYTFRDIKTLPFAFCKIPLVISESTKKQYAVVKSVLSRKDISEVINACDSDREGEHIFRNIIRGTALKYSPTTKFTRMWISNTTPEGIQEAFNTRKSSSDYNNLGRSALARSYADYHLGLNATMGMTSTFGKKANSKGEMISVGRVQTPTLKIICDREKEISDFKSKKSFSIKGKMLVKDKELSVNYVPSSQEKNVFPDLEKANEVINKFEKNKRFKLVALNQNKKYEKHKDLYSLSNLQVDMSSKHGYSAQEVLDTVQSLYEKHSLVTYPRTDEVHVSPEWALKLNRSVLESVSSVYGTFTREIQNNGLKLDSTCVASKDKIGSHEALTPTSKKLTLEEYNSLTAKEKNIYNAIVMRFLSCFYEDAVDMRFELKFNNGEETFSYITFKEVNPGFRNVVLSKDLVEPIKDTEKSKKASKKAKETQEKDDDENDEIIQDDITKEFLEELAVGIDDGYLIDVFAKEKNTKPPKRFTEGTLIKEMKNPSKYLNDKQDKDMIKKVEGIGTEATRASIIESLKKRNYIETKGKTIQPTKKGLQFIEVFPSEVLKSVNLTVDLERKLEMISEGELSLEDFFLYINEMDEKMIDDIKESYKTSSDAFSKIGLEEIAVCPSCGKPILAYKNCYRCSNNDCDTIIFKDHLNKLFQYKNITEKQAKELFENGITSKKAKGFVSKSGTKFDAYITYKKNQESKYPNEIFIAFENPNAQTKKKMTRRRKKS